MKFTGLESAPQDILDELGKCEVCGEQACCFVRDIFEVIPFGHEWDPDVRVGGLHRFCVEHDRPQRMTEIREGPLGALARLGAP